MNIEEIKKELLKLNIHECDIEDVFEILDKYDNQPDYKKEILHIGSRTGKTLQQVQDMVNYIKENKLTECNIKVLEVPNNYKSAFDEIFEKSHYKNITMEDMIEFSKKYNLGGE